MNAGSITSSSAGAFAIRRRGVTGHLDAVVDGRAVSVGAVGKDRRPERHAAHPSREVHGEVGRVARRRVADGVEVVGRLGERAPRRRAVAIDEGGAVEGRVEHLVRVDDERVGAFDAVQERARARREQRRAAVGAVHVQPQAVCGADVGHAGEVVEGARVGRSGRGDHGDDLGRVETGERLLEDRPVRRPCASAAGAVSQLATHDVRGGGHRGVRRGAGDDDAPVVRALVRRRVPPRARSGWRWSRR